MKAPALLAIAVSVAAFAGVAYAAATVTVDQKGLAFSTVRLTIAKGSVVRFTNSDATAHNILITGAGQRINGGLQQPGRAFAAPFLKPGAYQVTCGIHPKMKLSVVVK